MKFYIKKVILWLVDETKREVEFLPNKVNVLTGGSNTGKTDILKIIDYCFFASNSTISESIINENVLWYGITFSVNGKDYTIGRRSLENGNVVDDYYFSSTGEIPDVLEINNTENAIKSLLETEFQIDRNVKIPYGGGSLSAGSKISLRYFQMFNTISGNIIETDNGVFFDKQDQSRYKEALPRIFDLALGIEKVANILKKEKKASLEKECNYLTKRLSIINNKSKLFDSEKSKLIQEAKEFSLIHSELNFDDSWKAINEVLKGEKIEPLDVNKSKGDELESKIYLTERKILNLNAFIKKYKSYKKHISVTSDSLKPIDCLMKRDSDIIKTSIFDDVLTTLSCELKKIKKACVDKTPIDQQVNDEITSLEKQLSKLKEEYLVYSKANKNFENDKNKFIYLGEVKAKIEIYSTSKGSNLSKLQKEITSLEIQSDKIKIDDTENEKDLTIRLIEEVVQSYIDIVGTALNNYSNYLPVFDYKEKRLQLKKPMSLKPENIGSSSNHMFLQLFFSLAMHEVAFKCKSPYIAPYLIIDQFTRPYYGSGSNAVSVLKQSDESKVAKVFKLLNSFVESRIKNSAEFQMIVLEHVPSQDIKKLDQLKHLHIVEEFINDNALIPKKLADKCIVQPIEAK